MLLDSDWREELRLLRLNNPAYRIVFLVLDILRWFAYLAGALLLVAVCWYIVTPREYAPATAADTFGSNQGAGADIQDSAGLNAASGKNTATEPATAAAFEPPAEPPMTKERIEYLRSFANRVKGQPGATAQQGEVQNTAVDPVAERSGADEDLEVAQPATRVASSEGATDGVDLTVYAVPAPDSVIPGVIGDDQPSLQPPVTEQAPPEPIAEQQVTSAQTDAVIVPAKSSDQGIGAVAAEQGVEDSNKPVDAADLQTPPVIALATAALEPPTSASTTVTTSDDVPVSADADDLEYTPNNRPYAGTKWVMAQDENHYTIQIGSTVNRPFLVRFVDTLPEPHLAAIFNFRINRWDRWEHVLIYGSFDTREAANKALGTLSQANRRYGAFARSFKVIRGDMDVANTVTAQNSGSGAVQNQ